MSHQLHHRTDSPAVTSPDVPAATGIAATGADTGAPGLGAPLPLPHERDESVSATATPPDATIEQARRDIDAGKVDTDMRAIPGLDAENRARLVPGPAGKTRSATQADAKSARSGPNKVIPKAPRPVARRGKRA
jgi:hypothetical protein